MGRLPHLAMMSLDGYVADERGRYDRARRVPLELADERCFGNGAVHLHYRVVTGRTSGTAAGSGNPID